MPPVTRTKKARKKSGTKGRTSLANLTKTLPGVRVIWSPVNSAWQVLWGRKGAKISEMSVLRVISNREELIDYLRQLKGT